MKNGNDGIKYYNYNTMKYIPLDEVLKILDKNQWSDDWIHTRISTNSIEEIEKLKNIDLSIIDEMIEEATAENWTLTPFPIWLIVWTLRKLKERLSLNK